MKGAYNQNILYMPALYASKTIEELAAAKPANGSQVTFQQVCSKGTLGRGSVLMLH